MRGSRLIAFALFVAASCTAAAIGCSSGATSDGGGGVDASCPEATIDVAPPAPDASSADASDGAPAESDAAPPIDASDAADAATPLGLACAPAPEGIPGAAPPGPSAACTSAQIDAYLSDCLFNYDQTKCDQDYQASAACFDCIGTSEDAPKWGPLVYYAYGQYVNIGGCYAIVFDDAGAGGCGAARGAFDDCERSSCDRCWIADAGGVEGGTTALADDCFAAAESLDGGLCATYRQTLASSCPTQSPLYTSCVEQSGETIEDYVRRVVVLFCGGGDAGALDAAMDGD